MSNLRKYIMNMNKDVTCSPKKERRSLIHNMNNGNKNGMNMTTGARS
jgi:hypothetical protein